MYNHLITCKNQDGEYSCICESAPTKVPTLLFWPEDFGLSKSETEILTQELRIWCDEQPFEYIFHKGKGR